MGWTEDRKEKCCMCRRPLPCRLPVELRNTRCATCQMLAHLRADLGVSGATVDLTPEQRAERERRIELYRRRVEMGLPVFEDRGRAG